MRKWHFGFFFYSVGVLFFLFLWEFINLYMPSCCVLFSLQLGAGFKRAAPVPHQASEPAAFKEPASLIALLMTLPSNANFQDVLGPFLPHRLASYFIVFLLCVPGGCSLCIGFSYPFELTSNLFFLLLAFLQAVLVCSCLFLFFPVTSVLSCNLLVLRFYEWTYFCFKSLFSLSTLVETVFCLDSFQPSDNIS